MKMRLIVANRCRAFAMAGVSAALLAAAVAPGTATAQIDIRIGDGDFNISVWPECGRIGKVVDPKAVHQQARRQGFRNIGNITLVKRRYGRSKICGFYRATASKDGRRFQIYANANNARLLSARVVGGATEPKRADSKAAGQAIRQAGFRNIRNLREGKRGGNAVWIARAAKNGKDFRVFVDAGNGKVIHTAEVGGGRLNEQQAGQAIRQAGFRNIRNLREGKRGGNAVWIARAAKNGRDFRVFVDAGSGKVIQTAEVGGGQLNEQQARQAIRQAGFGNIRNLREDKRGGNAVWVARAAKNGRDFRVFVDAGSGKVIQTAEVGGDRLNEQQARRAMRQAGFGNVRNLRQVDDKGTPVWVARAQRNGKDFRVSVRSQDGKTVLRGNEIGSRRAPEEDVRAALGKIGYRQIEDLKLIRQGDKSFYAAVAWQDGYKWRVLARSDNGEAYEKKRLGGRIDADAARKRLIAAGYRRIEDLRWRDSGQAGTYVAQAWREGTQYRLVARGEDAKVVKDEAIAQRRADPSAVRSAVEADGFSAVDKVEFADGAYTVIAWKDGYRYRLRARARDGRVAERNRVGGRLGEKELRQRLGKAGYGRIGSIRFVDDGREGHYVVIAWQGERKYRLDARAESGNAYRRVVVDRRISEEELSRRLLARGFEKVDNIDLKKQDEGEDFYLATVWKNGHKYRLHARAGDGVPYRRELLEPRASEQDVRKAVKEAGFEDVRDIEFKEDRVGGHFEAAARKDGKTVHLHLRAHDGTVYHQRIVPK